MANFDLLPNEAVILKNDSVYHFENKKKGNLGELILTNLNLIYVKKGAFGGVKEVLQFPTSQIKIINGKPQAIIGKAPTGEPQLEVYFLNGIENFVFYPFKKREAIKWTDSISNLLNTQNNSTSIEKSYISGADVVTDTLKDTLHAFKDVLGIKGKQPENTTTRCMSCRAPLSGNKGQIVKCKYCDTEQSL